MTKSSLISDNPVRPIEERLPAEQAKLRGRPKKERASAIDTDIIKAALDLFSRMGYEGTAMEAVAMNAGISKRTLYLRYPDKKALLKEVIDSIVTKARHPDPPEFPDMYACLAFHVENFFIICDDPGVRLLFAMADKPSENLSELTSLGQEFTYELGIRRIAQTIADTAEKTGMPLHDPVFYATSLLDLAMAHLNRKLAFALKPGAAAGKLAETRIVRLLFAGMQEDCAAPV